MNLKVEFRPVITVMELKSFQWFPCSLPLRFIISELQSEFLILFSQ